MGTDVGQAPVQPPERPSVRGQHHVCSAHCSSLASEAKKSRSGSASGRLEMTLTLGEIVGSTWSPLTSTGPRASYRHRWPRQCPPVSTTCHERPAATNSSPSRGAVSSDGTPPNQSPCRKERPRPEPVSCGTPWEPRNERMRFSIASGAASRKALTEPCESADIRTAAPCRCCSHGDNPMWSGWSWVTKIRRSGLRPSTSFSSACHASRHVSSAMPVSTSVQESPSSISQTLMCVGSIGSGMRNHSRPAAICRASPGSGASIGRYSSSRRDGGNFSPVCVIPPCSSLIAVTCV